jgi:hypothetical protein
MPKKRDTRSAAARRLDELLRREIDESGVAVRRWKRNGGGEAMFGLRMVDIPRPMNAYLFGVAMHEIGHIALYRDMPEYNNLPKYMMEYHAELYAIDKLRKYGLPLMIYRAYAVKYVLSCLAQFKNAGGDIRTVPYDVRKWTRMKISKWTEAKWVEVENSDVLCVSDVSVKFYADKPKPNKSRPV